MDRRGAEPIPPTAVSVRLVPETSFAASASASVITPAELTVIVTPLLVPSNAVAESSDTVTVPLLVNVSEPKLTDPAPPT